MSKVLAIISTQRRARQGEYGAGSVSHNKRDDTHTARVMLDGEREYLVVYPTNEEAWRVIAAFWEDYERGIITGGKGTKLGQFGLDCIDEREKAGAASDIPIGPFSQLAVASTKRPARRTAGRHARDLTTSGAEVNQARRKRQAG